MIDIMKSRRGKLESKIQSELKNDKPNVRQILHHIDEYEKDNLESIDKLRRDRKIELSRIKGGLKQAIHAHGPITKELMGSATKRIHGALLENHAKPINKSKFSVRGILIGLVIGIIIGLVC